MEKNFLKSMTVIMMIGMFISCTVDHEFKESFTANQGVGMEVQTKKIEGDTVIGYTYEKYQEFLGSAIKFSVVPITIYKKAGVVKEDTISCVWPIGLRGVDPQYSHRNVSEDFSTICLNTASDTTVIENGGWQIVEMTVSNEWETANSTDTVNHQSKATTVGAVYAFAGDSCAKGYEADFDDASVRITEKTLANVEVEGLPYEGKIWKATKVESQITATFNLEGKDYTKELTVSNLAFFLKHEVNTRIENLSYVGKFSADGRFLTTDEERVFGELATYDNNEVSSRDAFSWNMNLGLSMSQPGNFTVLSEDSLKDTNFKPVLGRVASVKGEDNGLFAETIYAGVDSIITQDTTIVVPFTFSSWAWGDSILPYAKIADRKVSVKSEKDEEASTAAVQLYNVTVSMVTTVEFVGIDRENESYTVSVSYTRRYNEPDNFSTKRSQVSYYNEWANEGSRLFTKEQYNEIQTILYNRGELVSSSIKKYPLNSWIALSGSDTVVVANAYKPTVSGIQNHADKAGMVAGADTTGGMSVRYAEMSQTILVKGGNTLELEWHNETQYVDGKPAYDHVEITGVESTSFSEPVLVDSVRKGETVEMIYQINTVIVPAIKGGANKVASRAATRGAAAETTMSVSVPVYQKVVINDEYVDGSDRVDTTITVNGNIATITVDLYQTFTVTGERLVDSKSSTIVVKLQGTDGGEIIATDSIVVTNGIGLTGCGVGTYTNTVAGGAAWTNTFNYDAPSAEPIVLNGANGTVTVNIPTSWVISEVGQTVAPKVAVAGYDKYNYVSNVKGTYKVGNETIEVTAEATKTIKVARDVQDVTGRTIAWCNFSVVPAVKNETTGTYSYTTGKHNPVPCMVIGFEDGGAEAVLFENKPTVADVENAYYAAGNYTDIYNGAVLLNGNWVPAIARDETWGINYSLTGSDSYFPVGTESLSSWGWSSTVLTGYTCSVDNGGVLTVWKGSEIVLEIK